MAMYVGKNKVSNTQLTNVKNQNKEITSNGTYVADEGYTGFGTVDVNVQPKLQEKTITSNGTYVADEGYDGLSKAIVALDVPDAYLPMSKDENGKWSKSDITEFICDATDVVDSAFFYLFANMKNLISASFPNLVQASGVSALQSAFRGCTSLTSVSFPVLTTLGNSALYSCFEYCSKLSSVSFPALTTLSYGNLNAAFYSCKALTSVSFPALTSTSFGSYTNQFNRMLYSVTGCTVHFPSNLESVIGSWSDVTSGFGGTNTTVLFDLPATE